MSAARRAAWHSEPRDSPPLPTHLAPRPRPVSRSLHGFPPGYALVLDSPKAMQVSPMQIDTWNRDEMNISGNRNVKFVPGPLPASSLAPKVDPPYSGLLECPMTTRIAKNVDGNYCPGPPGAV